MIKKIIMFFVFAIMLLTQSNFVLANEQAEKIKPLKIEQDYEYGKLEKNFKNPNVNKNDSFSNVLRHSDQREPSIFRIVNSLIFVIVLILLTGWAYMKFKKINPEQLLSGKFKKLDENNFKILSSLQLGAGKAIYMIEINNKQLIVGTTATNVNLLAQMDKTQNSSAEIPKECIDKLFDKDENN